MRYGTKGKPRFSPGNMPGRGLSRGAAPWIGVILLQAGLAAACSTAPKRPAEILILRNQGETQLALVNRAAEHGNYNQALEYMREARRLALASDNPGLRIRTELARGNILFFLGRQEEAAEAWEGALAEAEEEGEEELGALCRIHQARARLFTAAEAPDAVRSRVAGELDAVKANPLSLALGWTVIGLADKEARRWADAENALKRALEIHEKGRYLEQAAYDWYLIASVRSVAGAYDSATEALFKAIDFDRRSENSWGLAKDWAALGEVYAKAGQAGKAAAAVRRSGEIFKALDADAAASPREPRSTASEGP